MLSKTKQDANWRHITRIQTTSINNSWYNLLCHRYAMCLERKKEWFSIVFYHHESCFSHNNWVKKMKQNILLNFLISLLTNWTLIKCVLNSIKELLGNMIPYTLFWQPGFVSAAQKSFLPPLAHSLYLPEHSIGIDLPLENSRRHCATLWSYSQKTFSNKSNFVLMILAATKTYSS